MVDWIRDHHLNTQHLNTGLVKVLLRWLSYSDVWYYFPSCRSRVERIFSPLFISPFRKLSIQLMGYSYEIFQCYWKPYVINEFIKQSLCTIRINYSVIGNHKIGAQKRGKIFSPHQVLNRVPLEPKASALPMSYVDPFLFTGLELPTTSLIVRARSWSSCLRRAWSWSTPTDTHSFLSTNWVVERQLLVIFLDSKLRRITQLGIAIWKKNYSAFIWGYISEALFFCENVHVLKNILKHGHKGDLDYILEALFFCEQCSCPENSLKHGNKSDSWGF